MATVGTDRSQDEPEAAPPPLRSLKKKFKKQQQRYKRRLRGTKLEVIKANGMEIEKQEAMRCLILMIKMYKLQQ